MPHSTIWACSCLKAGWCYILVKLFSGSFNLVWCTADVVFIPSIEIYCMDSAIHLLNNPPGPNKDKNGLIWMIDWLPYWSIMIVGWMDGWIDRRTDWIINWFQVQKRLLKGWDTVEEVEEEEVFYSIFIFTKFFVVPLNCSWQLFNLHIDNFETLLESAADYFTSNYLAVQCRT